jgi:hypothetical protein
MLLVKKEPQSVSSSRRLSPLFGVLWLVLLFVSAISVRGVFRLRRQAIRDTSRDTSGELRSQGQLASTSVSHARHLEYRKSSVPPDTHLSRRDAIAEERERYRNLLLQPSLNLTPWPQEIAKSMRSFADLAAESGLAGVHVRDFRCLSGGCEATLEYPAADMVERVDALLATSPEINRVVGSKFRSGPERRDDGVWIATLMLYPQNPPSQR